MVSTVLLVAALIAFVVGLIDHPPVTTSRMIALGLALVVLAQLLSGR